ncbi:MULTISPECIES: glycosyl hydrolase [Pseudofrankia]|uniref:glycosyl hydrolase n=1 Tax=Pseudofrankia TaxID=2994363 RepID=UPI001E2D9C96|nr:MULTISPECIES: glycosyl hydrolase [Pseudofrankia]
MQIAETWNDAADTTAGGATTWKSMNALWSTHQYFTDAHWPGELSLAQPMFANDQNYQTCATEDQIKTFMGELVKAWPTKDAFLRLSWEFNGNWYRWSAKPGDAANFKSCWIRWYKIVKGVSPGFKLVWNPNAESSDGSLNVLDFWPGAQYVDAAGPDLYANSDNGKLRDPNKLGSHGEPVGIAAWQAWVARQGVPFAVPEWGVNGDPNWGSTDPAYITQMRTAFEKAVASPSGLAYEDYFDGSTAYSCKFTLHDKECGYDYHAADAKRYLELWKAPYVKP